MQTQDPDYFEAVCRIWDNMATKKLYITGGIGSRAQGEGFGPEYELHNHSAYCETCASIANVYWNQRMFLATGESKYADVLERALYNGVISGVSLSGDRFFYDNPLESLGQHEREEWFGCACCPGNVTRFMASIPAYAYATHGKNIYTNLYVAGDASIQTSEGKVEIVQHTAYPWEGTITLEVTPETPHAFSLLLRIPGWAQNQPVPTDLYTYVDPHKPGIRITVNGKKIKNTLSNGYAVINRTWKKGDKITLEMDMPVRRTQAHPAVTYNEGLLSMERGPILYALEGTDQSSPYLFDMVIPRNASIQSYYDPNLLEGVVVLEGESNKGTFKAIPYSTWNNRGKTQLITWIPETEEYAIPQPEPTIASRAKMIGGYGFNDQFEPKSSADLNTPYQYWWLREGTEESIGYRFDEPTRISSVEVYWLEFDHYDVIYKTPESWKLLYKEGNTWKEVPNPSGYGIETDQYNVTTFDPVVTTELRLIAQLRRPSSGKTEELQGPQVVDTSRRGYSGGVIEWKINE